tara:strand:- start:934 stop:1584 length:651 start_codon:yes stop_codon:yes gene_type:complete
MSILDSYNKNKKKHLLKEVSATSATGTFVGGAGDIVDQLFAGPYHPEFGNIEKLLNKQIDGNIMKRMWTDDITPIADQDYIDLDWKYEYDKLGVEKTKLQIHLNLDDEKDEWKSNVDYTYDDDTLFKIKKLKFKNTSKDEMQYIDGDIEIPYDKILDKAEENEKFINDTEDWKSNVEYTYDDIEIPYDKIENKSEENEKFINDTSDWKSIYDNKKY